MIIRKLAIASAVAIGLGVSTTASAQSWHGFYVDGAIGARSTNTEVKGTLSSIPAGAFSDQLSVDLGKTNFLGEFSGGWRWAPGPVVVGVGAFVDLAGTNGGEQTSTDVLFGGSESTKVKQKSRYGLSVDIGPNWRTHPYAKLTYSWAKFETEFSSTGCTTYKKSNTHDGFGLGAGVRHLQTNNLYFFAEVMWQDYGSEGINGTITCGGVAAATVNSSKVSPTNVVGVIGAGWKF